MSLTLRTAITADQTTFDVLGGDDLQSGDFKTIESETIVIRTADPATLGYAESARYQVSVYRGAGGTRAAAHAAGATLATYSAGGGGGVSVTDGTTTVAETSAITATKVTEDAPGEITIIALPPGVGYDADEGILSIDGVITGSLEWTSEIFASYLKLARGLVEIKDNSGRVYVALTDGAQDAFLASAQTGVWVFLGSSRAFVVSDDAGNVNYLEVTPTGEIGFYGATPVARPTGVAVTAGAIHAALVSLGLIES